MSKSATEQFQIKKKRKLPFNVNATIRQNISNERYVHSVPFSSELLIKENFLELHIGDKQSEFNTLLQKISKSRTAAAAAVIDVYNFSDSRCLTSSPTKASILAAVPVDVTSALSATRTKNCLRDQTQVLRNDTMPLSHGFYVKSALASKRGLKALKTNSTSGSSTAALPTYEVSKRPRRSNENVKVQTSPLMTEEACNNLQLSYLLGESLARHGRLQEAFDIYAIIASEQPEGFIPLEKLNILATALVEHIRILSLNSKKTLDLLDSEMSSLKATTTSACLAAKGLNNDQLKLTTPLRNKYASSVASKPFSWQPTASFLSTHSSKLKDLDTDYLASAVGGNLDLHSPSRELPSSAINSCLPEDYDPFMCPLCRDVLRCPVTTNCGHTFCRQCCETISMCNICHVKFPRWQKDDFFSESTSNVNINSHLSSSLSNKNCTSLATLSTATTTTATTTMGLNMNTMAPNSSSNQQLYTSETSYNSTSTSPSASFSSSSLVSQHNDLPRLQIRATPLASPTTVTTTTIACTTDTATTTMASTASTSGSAAKRSNTFNDNMKFMPDVLVRRLVEKWWGCDLQAKKINETATSYMHLNLLDDALKFCNASLEKSPTNFKSLLLRAEVLRKMNHYQSSLADVDNALKTRYTSPKAHYLRALALSDLSRYEEALYEICLAIGLDKSASLTKTELFQHDLIKILQKLLSQTPKCLKADLSSLRSKEPYSVYSERRLLRKNVSLLNNVMQDEESLNLYEDEDFLSANYGKECDILAEDDVLACADFLNCADKRTTYANIAKKYEIELKRQATRKHFRRKWMQKEMELLPSLDAVESARCSNQFRNVLERMQQEIVRLKKLESSPEYFQRQLAVVSPSLIDSSDFDCVLCCRTFWKPVVTPCGHTYCLVCLDRCMDYTSSCPLCMSPLVEPSLNMYNGASSPVPLVLTKRPVTKFLEAAIKRFIPESYNKRFRQEMVLEPSVPIFICTTAFPYVPCPLFVYEQRYRLMVRRAVESGDKQFGIVQPHSEKSRYFDYGCILDIRDCVLLGDGCSILSTIGCKRFKILARHEKDGYETAKVEYIHDETISEEHLPYVSKMHDVVLSKAIQWYKSLEEDLKHEILQSYGEMPVVEGNWETIADGPAWAWWIIALLPLRPQLKVDILATTSLEKRLRAIEKTIHSMPGSCHYQSVSQNCDVAVVVHTQQHHHRGEDEEDVEMEGEQVDQNVNVVNHEEDDLTLDNVNEQEENQQQVSLQHHIENRNHDQQHSAQTLLEQQQQMHQQQCEDVSIVDECCQRTTSTALVHRQLEVAEDTLDITSDRHHNHNNHHHHHAHHRHRRSGHAQSLLL